MFQRGQRLSVTTINQEVALYSVITTLLKKERGNLTIFPLGPGGPSNPGRPCICIKQQCLVETLKLNG